MGVAGRGMANPEHLKILKMGFEAWNDWRAKNPHETPDLTGADLRGVDLETASLGGALLDRSNLTGVNLYLADLIGASLGGAAMKEAKLVGARLDVANLVGTDLTGAEPRPPGGVAGVLAHLRQGQEVGRLSGDRHGPDPNDARPALRLAPQGLQPAEAPCGWAS
jgi:hypothetical protein